MAVKFTEEQLNTFDKSLLIQLLVDQQEQNEKLTNELHDLNEKMQLVLEQLTLANKKRFGTSSEKMEIENQICFYEKDGYIKENLNSICGIGTINAESINNSNLTNYVDSILCTGKSKFSLLNVEKIYVLTDLETMGTNGYKFDAYMIDYIRKLDVNNSDKLIIVEYKRPAYDINFTQKRKNSSFITEAEKPMYETYIASLEW